jgi:hypothetical protein
LKELGTLKELPPLEKGCLNKFGQWD